jgi:hypothetical protein
MVQKSKLIMLLEKCVFADGVSVKCCMEREVEADLSSEINQSPLNDCCKITSGF